MKPFLAILGREIAERRLLLLGAAFASLFPVFIPWLPGPGGQDPAELRGGMALGLALITSALLALVLGATVIARDLSERRLGFYFARPIPGWAIWAGKMLGAALLSLGAGALVLVPALIAGGRVDASGFWGLSGPGRAGGGMSSPAVLFLVSLEILLLLVAGHAASVMVRSRSPWLAVDLFVATLVAMTLWACDRLLWKEGAADIIEWGGTAFAAISLVALAVAGLVQVARGRTDLRRGHRLLSLTLWGLVGAAALGHAAYALWALRVTPRDLVRIEEVVPAGSGSWISLRGNARGRGSYSPVFLLDIDSGRFVKLPSTGSPYWWRLPAFSRDGSRAVWMERIGASSYQLLTVDLRRPEPAVRRTNVIYSSEPRITLTPDGRRVAALVDRRLLVDDLDTGRTLAAVAMSIEPSYQERLRFLGPGRVRLIERTHSEEPGTPEVWRLSTLDLDLASRRIVPVSRIELPDHEWFWLVSTDGRRALLRRSGSAEARIANLDSGRTAVLPVPTDPGSLSFLEDGRLLLERREGTHQSLSVLTDEGVEQLHVDLPGSRFRIGTTLAPDLLSVATTERGSFQEDETWTSWLVDLRTGRLREVGPRMVPVLRFPWTGSLTESPPSGLFIRNHRELLLLDPATGRLRSVLKGVPAKPGL
ncbi:MAG TPA: hypothetical protein VEW48_27460 [Thermoanaerobaculia bacterium]|nr:hypothetical protein [Thermoanaerobaculia bacterium]